MVGEPMALVMPGATPSMTWKRWTGWKRAENSTSSGLTDSRR